MRTTKQRLWFGLTSLALLGLLAALIGAYTVNHAQKARAASYSGQSVTLSRIGTSSFTSGSVATDTSVQSTEIDTNTQGDTDGAGGDGIDRTFAGGKVGNGATANPHAKAKSNPELGTNFDGVNFFNQRFSNSGNQFSVEPPDQALCVGNGFVLESTNDVLAVYDTAGHLVKGPVDLNTFYGYPAAIDRAHGNVRGPSITDPICLYDQVTNRFVHVVLTLNVNPTSGADLGPNHLDFAVSNTADPTGSWTTYSLPVQNDGSQGTPNHQCGGGPCLGDYPHIGADRNGIYITTNEFGLFDGYRASQIYAVSKAQLTSGAASITAQLFDTNNVGPDGAGFTVWPAQTPGMQFADDQGGTEYFLSSRAVFTDDGTSTSILLWALTNTSSINSATPSLSLSLTPITVTQYGVPPRATQPTGNIPLGQCVTILACARSVGASALLPSAKVSKLNSNDSRMQQVSYANGKVWGALDTAVSVGGQTRAGIAYYIINPDVSSGTVSGSLAMDGLVGLPNTDLTYPALAVLQNGRGVMGFTETGDTQFPSAGYAGIDAKIGVGDIHIAAAGVGSWDGFTGYGKAFRSTRPRWGDYGAAAVDGKSIWIASEYIAQTCTFAQYSADTTCGGTRGALSNWATHVSQITP